MGDGTPFGRMPAPNRELLALDDYRARYAQYREDPDLQEAHRQHPFIVIWDDHEIRQQRLARRRRTITTLARARGAARRRRPNSAWREWMPVR